MAQVEEDFPSATDVGDIADGRFSNGWRREHSVYQQALLNRERQNRLGILYKPGH